MKKTTVVIPTYNEKENIQPLLEAIDEVYEAELKNITELTILFVDDNSPDGTKKEIDRLKDSKKYKINVLSRKEKDGLGRAYIAGFKVAIGAKSDFVIQMDADLSHEPKILPSMINALEENEFVIGSRYIKGGKLPKWSWARKMISKGGNLYSRIILGFSIHDYTGGFNGYRREVLEALQLDEIKSNGYSFQIEMKYRAKRAGFKFTEVPIHFQDRTYGSSKFSKGIFFEALVNTVKLRLSDFF